VVPEQADFISPGAGKLAALHDHVSTEFHAASAQLPDRGAPATPTFTALRARVAVMLRDQAPEIAERWETQSRTVALRRARSEGPATSTSPAVPLVTAFAATLAAEGAPSEDLVALGFAFGAEALEMGGSLHHTLKGLDLLLAMVLYAVETIASEEIGGTVADGIRLSRRLQQASSLLTLAAAKGYTEAMSDTMQDRLRHLRHDLRNPLGTIKSVLAMMDDETMPAEERTHPRFRAMAKRNARTLGELIAERLSDTEALVPALTRQRVSLRAIACGVRRDLRAHAEARSATVVVGSTRTQVRVDAIGLELLLHELLLAALQEATAGEELHVEFGEVHQAHASVSLRATSVRLPVSDTTALTRLTALARQLHGELDADDRVIRLRFPVRPAEMAEHAPEVGDRRAETSGPSGQGKSGHDVRGAGERDHGQSSAL
jgi:signal transduction histidine kinase